MPQPPAKPARTYINHHVDSTRWDSFQPRDDDVIITTSYKSGTTWTQQILHLLVFAGAPDVLPSFMVSPWLDARFQGPLDEVMKGLEAQKHRRFIKSHLPMDGLPHYPQAKYIVVGRDARDVFMSLWNHYNQYTDQIMEVFNDLEGSEPFPRPPEDIRQCWRDWMTRGWFEGETEGWPFWGNLCHTQSYWPHRDLDNLIFVHYSDLLADLGGQIQRIAEFLGMDLSEEHLALAVEGATFDNMKKQMREKTGDVLSTVFKGGADSFVYKGTNGRWREVLTDADLELYEAAKKRVLDPECAHWLEHGWLGE